MNSRSNTKLQSSSVHKKRKKRKPAMDFTENRHRAHQEPPTTTRSRRPAEGRNHLLAGLVAIFLIKQLQCDIGATTQAGPWGAFASDPEAEGAQPPPPQAPSQIRFQFDNAEPPTQPTSGQARFLQEPRDTFALKNQREVSINCLLLAPDNSGQVFWKKSDSVITLGAKIIGQPRVSVAPHRQRLVDTILSSLASANATSANNQTAGGGGGGSPASTQMGDIDTSAVRSLAAADELSGAAEQQPAMIVFNYTLTIANVSNQDEGLYQCGVTGSPSTALSRPAMLWVLRAPTSLEVLVRRSPLVATTATTTSGDEWQDGQLESARATPPPAHESGQATAEGSQPEAQVVEVRLDGTIRLECRARNARPRPELAWLDAQTGAQLVPRGPAGGTNASDGTTPTAAEDSFEEEANEQTASLVWSFQVRREHHMKVFTCQARHRAFELLAATRQAGDLTRLQRQSVQLSVVYAPEVELVRDVLHAPQEMSSLRLECQAHARPPVASYSWLVDDQLVAGAHEPELSIGNLTRQLHHREIKCRANNSVGSGSASMRLAIKYSPAYVTHLLPASLQPDYRQPVRAIMPAGAHPQLHKHPHASVDAQGAVYPRPNHHHHHHNHRRRPHQQQSQQAATSTTSAGDHLFERLAPPNQALSLELAQGAVQGDDVELHCDFDAYPSLGKVHWFKISTDYESICNVSPSDANDLIEFGANHARFRGRPYAATSSLLETESEHLADGEFAERLSNSTTTHLGKRHISIDHSGTVANSNEGPAAAASQFLGGFLQDENKFLQVDHHHQPGPLELDFELMSSELLAEMSALERHQAELKASNATLREQISRSPIIEPIASEPASSTHADIDEFLALQVRAVPAPPSRLQSAHAVRLGEQQPVGPRPSPPRLDLALLQSLEQPRGAQQRTNSSLSPPVVVVHKPRRAQVTSSSIRLRQVNQDTVGRYVCKAQAPEGFESQAKSIYLVLRKGPRIISANTQAAPLGARSLQVECLAQISTLQDNQTRIQWFKDKKLIDVMHKPAGQGPGQAEKSFSIIEELSPDALFVRSTLRIHGADPSDFGKYNCTIANSMGQDSMVIDLQALASTGPFFKFMALATLGSIFLFVALIGCLVFLLAPCRRFDSLAHGKSSIALLKGKKVIVVATANGGSPATNEQSAAAAAAKDQRRSCSPASSAGRASTLRKGEDAVDSLVPPTLMPANRPEQDFVSAAISASGQVLRRPESALSGAANTFGRPPAGGQFFAARASLRSQNQYQMPRVGVGVSMGHAHPPSSCGESSNSNSISGASGGSPTKTRFAAIHESLESKLQFGSAGAAGDERPSLDSQAGGGPAGNARRASLMERLRLRFQPAGSLDDHQDAESAQRAARNDSARRSLNSRRQRPTISMPLGGVVGGSGGSRLKRSSLSNSLTLVGEDDAEPTMSLESRHSRRLASGPGKHLMMAHLSHHHHLGGGGGGPESRLVSSSANLIQDSSATSASDGGTNTSSGRSSSTSNHLTTGAHSNHLGLHHHQPFPAHQAPQNAVNLAYHPDQPNGPYLVHQPAGSPWLAQAQTMTACDSNDLYANGGPQQQQQHEQLLNQQLYANEASFLHQQVLLGAGQQHSMLASDQYHHGTPQANYQLMGCEPAAYLAAGQQQQQHYDNERPCYAAICNGALMPQQAQHAGSPQAPILVPTSDGGDAYFESNYGTLLSQSSAYKTLGYHQASPQQQQHVNHLQAQNRCAESSSASSTPNSLTTHANAVAQPPPPPPPATLALNFSGPRLQLLNASNLSSTSQHHNQQDRNQLKSSARSSFAQQHFYADNNGPLGEEEEEDEDEEESRADESQVAPATTNMNNDLPACPQQQQSPAAALNGSSSSSAAEGHERHFANSSGTSFTTNSQEREHEESITSEEATAKQCPPTDSSAEQQQTDDLATNV